MSAYDDANPRQQDILTALGSKLGFSTSDITSITYAADIPVSATLTERRGTRTVFFEGPPLGGIITAAELDGLRLNRLSNQQPSGNVNSPGQLNRQTQSYVARRGRF